jgi:WD repeat-containing protein 19
VYDTIPLANECAHMQWSPSGSHLAILQKHQTSLTIWTETGVSTVETGVKHLQKLHWSLDGNVIAAGSSKGTLLMYDTVSGRKVPVIAKHSKAINDGAWGAEGYVCTSLDRSFTLSNRDGLTG